MNQSIHPNTPPKLVKKFRKCGSFHKLADEIEVNVKYVYELIVKGEQPNDTTENLREIRKRLHLTKRKRKRFAGCEHCGKLVEVADSGMLYSHSHPDGTYCKGSDQRDFLLDFKLPKDYNKRLAELMAKPKPPPAPKHLQWWNNIGKELRHTIVGRLYKHKEIYRENPGKTRH